MKDFRYMVYRTYTEDERPDEKERTVFYGWTSSKAILKAFMYQRDHSKYKHLKMDNEDVEKYYSDIDDEKYMLNYVKLLSSASGEEYHLYLTQHELIRAETKIHEMFEYLASLEAIKGKDKGDYMELIYNLQDYYFEALEYIGYRPREFDLMFPSAESEGCLTHSEIIKESLEDVNIARQPGIGIPGLDATYKVSDKIIFSIESFIKVMKDDM